MIDLIFWSFVVALVPIALSLGTSLLASIASPFGPAVADPFALPRDGQAAPHLAIHRVGRSGGMGHGR